MTRICKKKPRRTKRLCRSIKRRNTCENQLDKNNLRRCIYNTKHERCFDLPVRCRTKKTKIEYLKKPVVLPVKPQEIKQAEQTVNKLNEEILAKWEEIQQKRKNRLERKKSIVQTDLLTQIKAGKKLKKYTGKGYEKLKKNINIDNAKSCLLQLKYRGIWKDNINKGEFLYNFRKWLDMNQDDITSHKDFYSVATVCEDYEDMYDLMSQVDSIYKIKNNEDYKSKAKSCLIFMKNNNLWKKNMDYVDFINKISTWVPTNSKPVTLEMLKRYEELLEACSGDLNKEHLEDFINFMSELDEKTQEKPTVEISQVPLFIKEREQNSIQRPSLNEQIKAGIKLRKTPEHKRATFKESRIMQKASESISPAIREKIKKQTEMMKKKEDDGWDLKIVVNSG